MNTTTELGKLFAFAREHSAYYARHLQNVAPQTNTLDELPVIDPQQYWASSENLEQWPVLTSTVERALVFKTGGTTSAGKLSVFTREEWQTLVRDFGSHLAGQLNPGDRVANLFFVGDLYASFIFIHDALAHEPAGVTEYLFTGDVDPAVLADSIRQHRINVLAGVPAQLLTFAGVLERQARTLGEVETTLRRRKPVHRTIAGVAPGVSQRADCLDRLRQCRRRFHRCRKPRLRTRRASDAGQPQRAGNRR